MSHSKTRLVNLPLPPPGPAQRTGTKEVVFDFPPATADGPETLVVVGQQGGLKSVQDQWEAGTPVSELSLNPDASGTKCGIVAVVKETGLTENQRDYSVGYFTGGLRNYNLNAVDASLPQTLRSDDNTYIPVQRVSLAGLSGLKLGTEVGVGVMVGLRNSDNPTQDVADVRTNAELTLTIGRGALSARSNESAALPMCGF
jgi:hypothetical protein